MKLENNLLKILVKTTVIFILFASKIHASSLKNDFNNNLQNYNSKLTIFDKNHQKITEFQVAKAITNEQKSYGLMNLKKLDSKYGMIFIFSTPRIVTMWMKNTYIPLDMIFIDKNNQIITIQKNTTPHSLEIISSQKKVTKVLEVNANLVDKFNIKVGHKIKLQ